MNHSLAKLAVGAAVVIALGGCSGASPQTTPAATETTSPTSTPAAAPVVESASPSATATAPAATIASSASGVPVAEFCAVAERYLSKFQGLPRVAAPMQGAKVPGAIGCAYTAAVGDTKAPMVSMNALDLSMTNAIQATLIEQCKPHTLPPSVTKVDSLDRDHGWFAWTSPVGTTGYQAFICTESHNFGATILNVPNATKDDVINLLLAVME